MNNLPQMHMLEKYNCEKCRFSTKDVNKYKIHIALHNEMKYVCSHCNFESYTKTEFQRHLVSHTGKFPYTCEYCGYGAIRNDYIVKHIKRIHGDGKIQCSVSTVENESKQASVNIVQAQVRNNLQEILPNNTTPIAKNALDLSSQKDHSVLSSNSCHLNGTSNTDQVEVEVISPTDQPLNPWMTLTVVAPTSFKVPENCCVQVVEIKPINGINYLVLKCVEAMGSNGTRNVLTKENEHEQNISGPIVTSENETEPSNGSSLLQSATENLLPTRHSVDVSEQIPNHLPSASNENEIINNLNEVPSEIFDETEEVSDGPIISSVFSLSSGSQNVIEGIQWENPFVVSQTNKSNDVVNTIPALSCLESQNGPKVIEVKSLAEPERSCKQKAVLKNQSPNSDTLGVENVGSEIQLPLYKPVLPYEKKPESQTSALTQNQKSEGRKSSRLSKMEANLFSKPQTLFLSCDKRIVMEPLSCVMQTGIKAASSKKEVVPLKGKRPSAKPKGKILTRRFSVPKLKTLRLYPAKADQLRQLPHKNQPVVVLNHPEVESVEIASIMKAISMFKGMVLNVSLSKQTRRKII